MPRGRRCPARAGGGRGRRRRGRRRTRRPQPAARARRGSGARRRRRRRGRSRSVSFAEPVVRPLVVGRHAPLVAPPDRDLAPVGLERGGMLVGVAERRAARQHDRPAAARLRRRSARRRARSGRRGRGGQAAATWGKGMRPRLKPVEQIDAREPGPFAVRREEHVGLLRLDPAAPERRGELRQAEIAREAELVAAEPFEADDARPTRARARARVRAAPRRRPTAAASAARGRRSGRAGRGRRRAGRRARAGRAARARTARGRPTVGGACRPP